MKIFVSLSLSNLFRVFTKIDKFAINSSYSVYST